MQSKSKQKIKTAKFIEQKRIPKLNKKNKILARPGVIFN